MCCLKPSATLTAEIGLSHVSRLSGPLSLRSGGKAAGFALTWSGWASGDRTVRQPAGRVGAGVEDAQSGVGAGRGHDRGGGGGVLPHHRRREVAEEDRPATPPSVRASVVGTLPETSPAVLVLAPPASLKVASGGSWSERPVPLDGTRS